MLKTLPAFLGPVSGLSAALRPGPDAPQPVRVAARCMYAGAGASGLALILAIVSAFSLPGLKSSLVSTFADQLKKKQVTMDEINTYVSQQRSGVVVSIVLGIVIVALWAWMAKMNGLGRSWARLSATAFFVLWTIETWIVVNSFKDGQFVTVWTIISLILQVGLWLIGLAAIALLWRPASTAYFNEQSGKGTAEAEEQPGSRR